MHVRYEIMESVRKSKFAPADRCALLAGLQTCVFTIRGSDCLFLSRDTLDLFRESVGLLNREFVCGTAAAAAKMFKSFMR